MAKIGKDVASARKLLETDDVVAIPTETVYGLAGNALSENAVLKIFKIKNRPFFDPLIVHIRGDEDLDHYVRNVPDSARELAARFWPGPLTLLLEKNQIIPLLVTSGSPRVAVRAPQHPLTRELLGLLSFPLAAPSANPFGYISPTRAEHVDELLGKHISYILDGGPCTVGIESTIIGWENDRPVLYRPGGIPIDTIEAITGKLGVPASAGTPSAAGQLKSHYAPRAKVITGTISELLNQYKQEAADSIGVLSFQKDYGIPNQRVLSPSGNLDEAARNFFAYLRALDRPGTTLILAEYVPDAGLGKAINDRLQKASA